VESIDWDFDFDNRFVDFSADACRCSDLSVCAARVHLARESQKTNQTPSAQEFHFIRQVEAQFHARGWRAFDPNQRKIQPPTAK
jgi:hypothetical protein